MNLKGKKIYLRALNQEDMKLLNQMINDDYIEKMVVGWNRPISEYEQNEWYANLKNDDNIRYAINTVENKNNIIGSATIRNIDWKNRSASYDIKMIKEFTGKGLGTDTIQTLLKYSFKELNLNRINVNIIEYNEASKKMFEKCGFIIEGVQRKAVFKNGKYHSVLNLGILKEDFVDND